MTQPVTTAALGWIRGCSLGLAAALVVAGVLSLPSIAAAELTDEQTDQAVDGALGGWSAFPWYDPETKGPKVVPGSLERLPPPPDLSQLAKAQPAGPATGGPAWNWGWLGDLIGFFYAYLPWVALVIAVIVLIVLLSRAYLLRMGPVGPVAPRVEKPKGRTEIERLENLPFKVARSQDDLLGEARRQYEAGNYNEAIIYYFSYQLVELDRHQKLRLERGKTNRQYLRELRAHQNLANIFRGTMYSFEDVFFGHHALERVEFESCWRNLDEFQRSVQIA